MTLFEEPLSIISIHKKFPKKLSHLKEDCKIKFILQSIQLLKGHSEFGLINFEASLFDGYRWNIVYSPIGEEKMTYSERLVFVAEQILSKWYFSNLPKNENVYFYRFLNVFRNAVSIDEWRHLILSLQHMEDEILKENVHAFCNYRGKLDEIDRMLIERQATPRPVDA